LRSSGAQVAARGPSSSPAQVAAVGRFPAALELAVASLLLSHLVLRIAHAFTCRPELAVPSRRIPYLGLRARSDEPFVLSCATHCTRLLTQALARSVEPFVASCRILGCEFAVASLLSYLVLCIAHVCIWRPELAVSSLSSHLGLQTRSGEAFWSHLVLRIAHACTCWPELAVASLRILTPACRPELAVASLSSRLGLEARSCEPFVASCGAHWTRPHMQARARSVVREALWRHGQGLFFAATALEGEDKAAPGVKALELLAAVGVNPGISC